MVYGSASAASCFKGKRSCAGYASAVYASMNACRRCNEQAYGTLVLRRALGGTSTTINSHWRRYAFCESGITPCGIQRRDLYVP